ncbi:hypothetical protein ACSBR2_014322 [Camellia fascicularis]
MQTPKKRVDNLKKQENVKAKDCRRSWTILKSEQQLKKHEKNIKRNSKKIDLRALPCSDLLMRMQLNKENNNIDLSIPLVRLGEKEKVTYEAATIALRKAIRLNCAIQARDGHWATENAGPIFFTPLLIIILHISGAINTILAREHKKELVRYTYLHQICITKDPNTTLMLNIKGFYIEGHNTMIGLALNNVALRLLGEGPNGGQDGAMTKAWKWIRDNGGAIGIPSWGKTYLSVLGVYEWAGCNPPSPEFWLFPSFLPITQFANDVLVGENPDGNEFKHHLARVPDYLWLAEDGMKMQMYL